MKIKPLILALAIFQCCNAQKTINREIHNDDFNWTITIPENFENVQRAEWEKMQNRGLEAIENTYDQEIVNEATTIFAFKSDELNYFESNHQPFDPAVDGDYLESCEAVNNVLYETFITQMPGIKIDTLTSVEKIDNLDFQTMHMKVEYPNKMVLHAWMFSRLFDKKELAVNIMYVDAAKGEKMLTAWRISRFGKR